MPSVNDIVGWLKSDLSRPNDTNLDAIIISKMGEAQNALEERAFLPWFLRTSDTIQNVLTSNEILLTGLTGFIRLQEEEELAVVDPTVAAISEPLKFLRRDDSFQLFISRELGTASDAVTVPTHFYVADGFRVEFRPRIPTTVQFSFRVAYYRSDPTVPAVNLTTLWSRYAAQLLKAETGKLVAMRLRDQTNLQRFSQDAAREMSTLMRRHQAQLDVQQEYVMGE